MSLWLLEVLLPGASCIPGDSASPLPTQQQHVSHMFFLGKSQAKLPKAGSDF